MGDNMRNKGKITHWNEAKGFGFITPKAKTKPIFAHIKSFNDKHQLPKLNQVVSYNLSKDKQGRNCAINISRKNDDMIQSNSNKNIVQALTIALNFILFVAIFSIINSQVLWFLYTYILLSLITFSTYAIDKSAAQQNEWRISEKTLHLFSILGGWPGALIARHTLHHKSSKQPFCKIFWWTVIINISCFISFSILISIDAIMLIEFIKARLYGY